MNLIFAFTNEVGVNKKSFSDTKDGIQKPPGAPDRTPIQPPINDPKDKPVKDPKKPGDDKKRLM